MEVVRDAVSQLQGATNGYGVAVVSGSLAAAAALMLVKGNGSPSEKNVPTITDLGKSALNEDALKEQVTDVLGFFSQKGGTGVSGDKNNTPEMVQKFYNLVTDIYEWGWGQCFHFAPRQHGQNLQDSIRRHEEMLATAIELGPNKTALDVGCGVGGPMRNIARFSGGNVQGITICGYQVKRGTLHNERAGLTGQCRIKQGNFMEMPFEENSFDCAYAIEATCHAPNLTKVYSEIFRVLKPGSLFCTYEWLTTDEYDPKNPRHVEVIDGINYANGLPDMRNIQDALRAMHDAGFRVVRHVDLRQSPVPWYQDLKSGDFVFKLRDHAISALEFLHIAPKGTAKVHAMLTQTAKDLVAGGELGIFTPMYMIVAQKPE
jgi:24-methylenesterol C-methyltransferase